MAAAASADTFLAQQADRPEEPGVAPAEVAAPAEAATPAEGVAPTEPAAVAQAAAPTEAPAAPPQTPPQPSAAPPSGQGDCPGGAGANATQAPALELEPGGERALSSLPPALRQAIGSGVEDSVVVGAWPKPHWLHVVASRSEDHPSNAIRSRKLWECPLTMLAHWALTEGCAEEHCSVIDIGMNIGWFTALAAASGKRVLAFEPNMAPARYAMATVAANGWGERVLIINGGVSSDGAKLHVLQYLDNSGSRSATRAAARGSVEVPSYRLDDVVDARTKVCYMKVDCQGCEAEAFRSGAKLLSSGRVQAVQLEYNHDAAARDALETLHRLSAPRRWHCITLPVGLDCEGRDLHSGSNLGNLWDFVVAGVSEGCKAARIDEVAPRKLPGGFYTDLWLIRDELLASLQEHPEFKAAGQRRARAAGKRCSYTATTSGIGVCDLFCHRYTSLAEAQRACDPRPSCHMVVSWQPDFHEMRGRSPGKASAGGVRAHVKESCA